MLRSLGGEREKLVVDLSCRRRGEGWFVAMDKWQTVTDMEVNEGEYFFLLFMVIFLPCDMTALLIRCC